MRQIYEYHPVIGFRFIPETKVRMPHEGGGYLLKTNDMGFRCDRDFDPVKKPGTQRILLFGDSFTAGEGVSNGQRYGDHLEKLIPNLEVFNFGLPATGLDQHYLIYKEYAQAIEHDLLVIAVFVENVRRVGSRFRYFHNEAGKNVLYAKPYYTLDATGLHLNGIPPPKLPVDPEALSEEQRHHIFATERFPRLKKQFNNLKRHPLFDSWIVRSGLKDRVLQLTGYQPVKEYEDARNPAWQVMRELIREWIGEHGKPVVLMPIPLHHYVYGLASARAYQQRLREATESAGGHYVETLPGLKDRPMAERQGLYFPNDGHLTPAGHLALAQTVAPLLAPFLTVQ